MATQFVRVLVGTTSARIAVTPLVSVAAAPAVLGGSVLVEFSRDGVGNWRPWQYGTITQGGSFRSNENGWVRCTATTQAANMFLCDVTGANDPNVTQMVNVNNVMATGNATTEQVLLGIRIPPGYLSANFNMSLDLSFGLTNNANVKTIRVRWGGVAGTALFTSPSVASALNYNASIRISGRGDGSSLIGYGAGASGGIGISTTAYPTLTYGYMNLESDLVVTITKATGTDTGQLESAMVALF